jgi:hypothetical protein
MSFNDDTEELLLYADNDEPLYRRKMMSFLPNVRRKIEQGKYDPVLAPKLWLYWVTEAAKKYEREFPGTKFSLASRQKAAHEVAKRELQMLMSGEYGPPPAFKPGRGRKAHSPATRSAYRGGRHGARHRIDLAEHRALTEAALGPVPEHVSRLGASRELKAKARLIQLHAWETGRSPEFAANAIRKLYGIASHSPVRASHRGSTRTGKFVVRGKSGKVAGRYHTKAEAEHRIAQLKANAERLRAFRFGKR